MSWGSRVYIVVKSPVSKTEPVHDSIFELIPTVISSMSSVENQKEGEPFRTSKWLMVESVRYRPFKADSRSLATGLKGFRLLRSGEMDLGEAKEEEAKETGW